MALSARQAPLRNLVLFKQYAKARGCRVTEALPEDRPKSGAHAPKSFHYDTGKVGGVTHSHAADINYGPAGTSDREREMLRHLVAVAQSFGLAVIYALYGREGAAASHTTHLHVDIGSWSNLGKGGRQATPGDAVAWDTQDEIRSPRDNLAGPDTIKRLRALRAASNYGGVRFPYGTRFTQDVVGTKKDGDWGRLSRQAHDDTTEGVQRVWSDAGLYTGAHDGIWGPLMERAFNQFISEYKQ